MNRLAKGNRSELKAKVWLLKQGFPLVERITKTRFSKDLFTVADIVVINKSGELIPVQVKSNQPTPDKKYTEWVEKYNSTLLYINVVDGRDIEWSDVTHLISDKYGDYANEI